MAEMANIVAYDHAAGARTFYPVSVVRNGNTVQAKWRESVVGVPIHGQSSIEASMEELPKSGVYKVVIKTMVPVMETVGAVNASGYTSQPKVAHVLTGITTFLCSPRATNTERHYLQAVHQNIVAGRATDAAPPTTTIVAELVQQLRFPY